ncbi:MAG: hypothetical protein JO283_01535 [Bradyrhizobium sp.]|nr:hypothetical protein [Bradyrhizobium sp.]
MTRGPVGARGGVIEAAATNPISIHSGGRTYEHASIELFTWATPNGWKASCTLEELQMPYTLHPVDIMKGKQREREYVKLKPKFQDTDDSTARIWGDHDLPG